MREVLSVTGLSKIFSSRAEGDFVAVENVSFTLAEGEILGLLGPNGAGKTTTLQMLLGILTPTGGNIEYFGKDFNTHQEEILEQINFSSTYTNLPWALTIKEALTYSSYLYNIQDRASRVAKMVEIFRLQKLFDKEVNSLSAGQLTRLNLAKAFLNYPRVLLLDEPTASLDPETADHIRQFILRQREQFEVSILFTSHNMAEVSQVCDRVMFINHGQIVAIDTPQNLAKQIKNAKLELVVIDGLKRIVRFCSEQGFPCQEQQRAVTVEIPEKQIARFLQLLADHKITYDQISIQKPNLEDYFLAMARKKESR